MYVDLLSRALGRDEEGRRSEDLLLADLVHSRARLLAMDGQLKTPVAEALARELSYDSALIRLCESLDVASAPDRFAEPGARARAPGARNSRHVASHSRRARQLQSLRS